jgi:hypothetical protein
MVVVINLNGMVVVRKEICKPLELLIMNSFITISCHVLNSAMNNCLYLFVFRERAREAPYVRVCVRLRARDLRLCFYHVQVSRLKKLWKP